MNCVLIVEDDSDINNFINDYFVIKGYSTIQAFSGTEGLLRLKNERDICCVILDLMFRVSDNSFFYVGSYLIFLIFIGYC